MFPQMYTFARFFPSYFSCPFYFVGFLFSYFCRFILFHLLLHKNEGLHCLCWSSDIYFYGLLAFQSKAIAKFLRKSER